jgi:hypothetical protein
MPSTYIHSLRVLGNADRVLYDFRQCCVMGFAGIETRDQKGNDARGEYAVIAYMNSKSQYMHSRH